MLDNRTYVRIIFDKLLKDNIVFKMTNKIVKFYYAIFSHPLKILKFEKNIPLEKKDDVMIHRFGIVNSKSNILG